MDRVGVLAHRFFIVVYDGPGAAFGDGASALVGSKKIKWFNAVDLKAAIEKTEAKVKQEMQGHP